MSINPRDYDLDELRELADGPGPTVDGNGGVGVATAGDDHVGERPLRDGLYRELLPLEAGGGTVEKPYLPELPESYVGEQFLFEWLEFLQTKAGYQGATEALSYYESIGWLTPAVESALGEYLLGIENGDATGDLDIDDHVLSLAYIAKLASMRRTPPSEPGGTARRGNHND
jgi:flagellar protein FlaE